MVWICAYWWETTDSKSHGPIIMLGKSKIGSSSHITFIGGKTTNSKPHGPIIMLGYIKNREQQSDHIYYTLPSQVQRFALPLTSLSKLCKMPGSKVKTILLSQTSKEPFDWLAHHQYFLNMGALPQHRSFTYASLLVECWYGFMSFFVWSQYTIF